MTTTPTRTSTRGLDELLAQFVSDLGATMAAGNVVIGEDRVRYAMEVAAGDAFELQRELDVALGSAWDEELEPFRHAGDDQQIVWLHKVG